MSMQIISPIKISAWKLKVWSQALGFQVHGKKDSLVKQEMLGNKTENFGINIALIAAKTLKYC